MKFLVRKTESFHKISPLPGIATANGENRHDFSGGRREISRFAQ